MHIESRYCFLNLPILKQSIMDWKKSIKFAHLYGDYIQITSIYSTNADIYSIYILHDMSNEFY
jgi:hypothetical protein